MSKLERTLKQRPLALAGLTVLLAACAGPSAGESRKAAGNTEMKTIDGLTGPAMPVGESEREVRTYDIAQNLPQLGTHLFRTRYVDVAPGGVVPIHSHTNRPSLYLITSGEIMVHQTGIAEPLLLKTGDSHMAAEGAAHWWENKGTEKVAIWVADICPEDDPMVKMCDKTGETQ